MFNRYKSKVKLWNSRFLNSPLGRPVKKAAITLVGVIITLIGFVLIILPGPAFLLIPVGLAVLAIEYPIARRWLRKCQHWMTVSAKKADAFIARNKVRFTK